MKIGIDIDDTITETEKTFRKYIKRYRRKNKIKKYSKEKQLSDEDFLSFFEQYGEEIYMKLPLKKHVVRVLKKWILEGHLLYIVTARTRRKDEDIELWTRKYFEKLDISFEKMIFNSRNKYEDTKEIGLDVFIDDREDVLQKFPSKDIFLIRMVSKKNIYSKFQKVVCWKDIEKIIDNL